MAHLPSFEPGAAKASFWQDGKVNPGSRFTHSVQWGLGKNGGSPFSVLHGPQWVLV